MRLKQCFAIFVATLVGAAGVVFVPTATAVDTLITMPDGSQRPDVILALNTSTHRMWVDNFTNEVIEVTYSDPTYGMQSAVIAPQENAPMCANPVYRSPVSVTFGLGTASQATGTGQLLGVGSPYIKMAKQELKSAEKALKKAKRSHKKARIKRAKVRVRSAKQELGFWRHEYTICLTRRLN